MASKYIVSAIALAAGLASALPPPTGTVTTNAQRLKSGQPPMPPKARGRRDEPMPSASMARRDIPAPSPSAVDPNAPPLVPACGRLLVNLEGVDVDKYIQAALVNGVYMIGASDTDAVEVTYADNALTPTNGAAPYPFIGGSVATLNAAPQNDLGPTTSNFAYLASTGDVPYGQAATLVDTSYDPAQPSENAIFYLDMATGEVTVQWVNTDESFVDVQFVVNALGGNEIVVGDATALRAANPTLVAATVFCENLVLPLPLP